MTLNCTGCHKPLNIHESYPVRLLYGWIRIPNNPPLHHIKQYSTIYHPACAPTKQEQAPAIPFEPSD